MGLEELSVEDFKKAAKDLIKAGRLPRPLYGDEGMIVGLFFYRGSCAVYYRFQDSIDFGFFNGLDKVSLINKKLEVYGQWDSGD